jgi:hypothetical protein
VCASRASCVGECWVTAESPHNSANNKALEITCPGSKKLIGGGARLYDAGGDVALDESYPSSATT